jgi:omega-6 fatty acid desaturase (delta-12 desaturase)
MSLAQTAQGDAPWQARLAPYRRPDDRRSTRQLAVTALLFAAAWALMYWSLGVGYWLTLLLAVPAAFMLVRLFIIQHDCGHGSFFASQKLANRVGAVLGVLTMTPYQYWRKTHALHHSTSGNLEHRGFGDIDTWTVDEYVRRTPWQRFKYRVYRHPAVLFVVGAVLHFFVLHRLPQIVPRAWRRERRSILRTNLGIAAFVAGMSALVGLEAFVRVHLPIVLLSCSIGVWLFYVQHQFERTYWEHDESWDYELAALEGSSYYALPRVLQWLTGSIGLHHIHHLSAGIPNYRLQEVFDRFPDLQRRVTRITLGQSLRCVRLALWDERARTLVGFPSRARLRLLAAGETGERRAPSAERRGDSLAPSAWQRQE